MKAPNSSTLLIPAGLMNWSCGRRLKSLRMSWIVFLFVESRFWSRDRRTTFIDWLSSIAVIIVGGIHRLRFSTDWSSNHIFTLRIRDSYKLIGLSILRCPWSGVISVDALVLLTWGSLISHILRSWLGRAWVIDRLRVQRVSNRAMLAVLPWLPSRLNVYW